MTNKSRTLTIVCCALAAAVMMLTGIFYHPVIKFLETNGVLKSPVSGNYLEVLDVGEAEAILIVSNGQTALIDTGDIGDAGYGLTAKLKRTGIRRIDRLVLTHPHTDHAGGLITVMSEFEIGCFYYTSLVPSENDTAGFYDHAKGYLKENNINVKKLANGMDFSVGSFKMKVLSCNLKSAGDDENNSCAVIRAEADGASFLLMSDAGSNAEAYLRNNFGAALSCDVLKVGHHGSSGSTSEAFLQKVAPEYAVISCGAGNSYGHPSTEVTERLTRHGVKTYRTDLSSDVTFFVNTDGKISVKTAN